VRLSSAAAAGPKSRMAISRRATLLCFFALSLDKACGEAAAPLPVDDPVPFAKSETPTRFWPVITDAPHALVVPAALDDGAKTGAPLRQFAAPRPAARADHPTRHHVGVDLTARAGDRVVAMEDGRVVAHFPFLRAATGEMSWALMLAHAPFVALYGELRERMAEGVAIGASVAAGQRLGAVSDTAQLHIETYAPGATRNARWRWTAPPPANVLNPTQMLIDLAREGRRIQP